MSRPATPPPVHRRLAALAARPLPWLLLLLAISSVQVARDGLLTPRRVPDTVSYIQASRATSTTDALSRVRTVGYPLLLRLAAQPDNNFPGRWRWVPRVHLAAWLAAILLWWHGVSRFTGSSWAGFAAAAPLPWAQITGYLDIIQPDFLASALGLASLALLLLLVRRPGAAWVWPALGLAVAAGYHLRPAAVFLAGLVPVLAGLLALWALRRRPGRALGLAAGTAALTLLPLLAFAGLRWGVVGHFGLVSFGGYNLAGMAACFTDPGLAAELEPPIGETARRTYGARLRRGWQPMTGDDDPADFFPQYSDSIWDVAVQVMKAQLSDEGAPQIDVVAINQRLTEFGRAVVAARPRLYLRWIGAAMLYGLAQLDDDPWVLWPAALVALSLPFTWRRRSGESSRPFVAVMALGPVYFAAYLVLVSLVSFPFARYHASTTLLLPSSLTLALYWLWSRRARRAR